MKIKGNDLFTSDLHINHIRGSQWRGFSSLDEHNNFIIDSFNSVVKNKDARVFIVGDVLFQPATSMHFLRRLYGKKYLILGNHDVDPRRYGDIFEGILGSFSVDGQYAVTHIPIHSSQMERFKFNIHGHEHMMNITIRDPRYINVNCELHDYKPITFDNIWDIYRDGIKYS